MGGLASGANQEGDRRSFVVCIYRLLELDRDPQNMGEDFPTLALSPLTLYSGETGDVFVDMGKHQLIQ